MAADDQEKTEEPTEKKLSDARKKGQVARSKELSTMAILVGGALVFLLFGSFIGEAMFDMMKHALVLEREDAFDTSRMLIRLGMVASDAALTLFVFLLVMLIFGVAGTLAVGGFNFSWEAAAPKFNKLNPISGLKRIFGVQGLVELAKSIAKVAVIIGVAYTSLVAYFPQIMHISVEILPDNLFTALDIFSWIFLWMALSMIVIAAIDVPYQLWNHTKQLRMTHKDIKDEHKNTEGDPMVKGRIRRAMMQASNRRMMQAVPDADVVVTNPTHYSVAIKYDTNKAGAPIVLAKGADQMAFHIRDIAEAHDIPVMSSPMLARSIYHTTEVDDEIPEKLFAAVAQVLAYVFQLKDHKKGKAKKPKEPKADKLPIPPEVRY